MKGRLYRGKRMAVFVATGGIGAGLCPALKIAQNRTRIRDDYHGEVRIAKKLTKLLA